MIKTLEIEGPSSWIRKSLCSDPIRTSATCWPVFESDVVEVFEVRNDNIESFNIYFDTAPFPIRGNRQITGTRRSWHPGSEPRWIAQPSAGWKRRLTSACRCRVVSGEETYIIIAGLCTADGEWRRIVG